MLGEEPDDVLNAEDFGQKVDLTARIRDILANYPDDRSIIKELLQVAPASHCRPDVHRPGTNWFLGSPTR